MSSGLEQLCLQQPGQEVLSPKGWGIVFPGCPSSSDTELTTGQWLWADSACLDANLDRTKLFPNLTGA